MYKRATYQTLLKRLVDSHPATVPAICFGHKLVLYLVSAAINGHSPPRD